MYVNKDTNFIELIYTFANMVINISNRVVKIKLESKKFIQKLQI